MEEWLCIFEILSSRAAQQILNSESIFEYLETPQKVTPSIKFTLRLPRVLYMSFDRFLLAVESRDLSQADKSIMRVSIQKNNFSNFPACL